MTTENVTVLFTDLVGSTRLQSSVSPDVADEHRRDHFTILRRSIAETGGHEVKNLGDGLMVVFASASAALAVTAASSRSVVWRLRACRGARDSESVMSRLRPCRLIYPLHMRMDSCIHIWRIICPCRTSPPSVSRSPSS